MSKEMTPKDALRRISGFISFCCYEYFDKELEKDWKKDIDTITQALDRLELLEKNNQEIEKLYLNENKHWCETIDSLRKENQELETDKKMLNALYQEVKDTASFYMSKCEKFKKIIDILKDKANIRLHILTNTDGSKIYEIEFIFTYYSTIHEITQQEYDLLKEFLK